MTQYLLSMYHPGSGETPPPDKMAVIMKKVGDLRSDLQANGSWVFGNGLHGPEASTVVLFNGDELLTTDGPFAETKEHLGGITIIDVPDLDAALSVAGRLAEATAGLPIEVRPFQG